MFNGHAGGSIQWCGSELRMESEKGQAYLVETLDHVRKIEPRGLCVGNLSSPWMDEYACGGVRGGGGSKVGGFEVRMGKTCIACTWWKM